MLTATSQSPWPTVVGKLQGPSSGTLSCREQHCIQRPAEQTDFLPPLCALHRDLCICEPLSSSFAEGPKAVQVCVSFPSQLICCQNRPCSDAAKQQVALKSLFLTLYYFHLYCCLYKQVLCMPSLHPSYSTFIFLHINGMRNHSEFLVQAR